MSVAALIGSAWFWQRLSGAAGLVTALDTTGLGVAKIREDLADLTWPAPYIVYSLRSAPGPAYKIPSGLGEAVIWDEQVWAVDLLTPGQDNAQINTLVRLIAPALQDITGPCQDARIVLCRRAGSRRWQETTDGRVYTHTASDWRVRITPAT